MKIQNQFFTLILILVGHISANAAVFDSFDISHCTIDENMCGEVLVGAARVELGSIRAVIIPASLRIDGDSFGFTGPGDHGDVAPPNSWFYYSAGQIQVNGTTTNPLGFFFAPETEGPVTGQYLTSSTNQKIFEFKGIGVADSGNAIDLEIIPSAEPNCEGETCALSIVEQGQVKFTITPKINSLPANLDLNLHKHIKFSIIAQEYDTNCRTFVEQMPNREVNDVDNYLDYLDSDKYDRKPKGACGNSGQYHFLASVNKEISFTAINKLSTGDGYVRYVFYANGHYSPRDGTCSASGCKIFDIRTDNSGNVSPPTTTTSYKLEVSVTDGSVTPDPVGTDCGANCWTYPSGATVKLTAMGQGENIIWSGDCDGSTPEITIKLDKDKSCTATFSSFLPEESSFKYGNLEIITENGTTVVTLRVPISTSSNGEDKYKFTDSTDKVASTQFIEAKFEYPSTEIIPNIYYWDSGNGKVPVRIPLPLLVSAIYPETDNSATDNSTPAEFHGGISRNNGMSYEQHLTAKLSDTVVIRNYFKPSDTDIGKEADILLIIQYEGAKELKSIVSKRQITTDNNALKLADLGMAEFDLAAEPNQNVLQTDVILTDEVNINIQEGIPVTMFGGAQKVNFYFAYRLNSSNTITYSSEPISLTILP